METQEFICIRCPMGCALRVQLTEGQVSAVEGNGCRRGADYAAQEAVAPIRTVTSSVRVTGSGRKIVSVKTVPDVPKGSIFAVMEAIRTLRISGPVRIGDTLLRNIAGTGSDLVATANTE